MVSVSGGGSCVPIAAGTVGGTLTCNGASINAGVQQTVNYRMRPLGNAAGSSVVNSVAATTATISLEPQDGGFAITASHLDVVASIPGIDDATFQDLAAKAKAGCPVSKVLNAEISMDAKLG